MHRWRACLLCSICFNIHVHHSCENMYNEMDCTTKNGTLKIAATGTLNASQNMIKMHSKIELLQIVEYEKWVAEHFQLYFQYAIYSNTHE